MVYRALFDTIVSTFGLHIHIANSPSWQYDTLATIKASQVDYFSLISLKNSCMPTNKESVPTRKLIEYETLGICKVCERASCSMSNFRCPVYVKRERVNIIPV